MPKDDDLTNSWVPPIVTVLHAAIEMTFAWPLYSLHSLAFRWSVRSDPIQTNTLSNVWKEYTGFDRRPGWWYMCATPHMGSIESFVHGMAKVVFVCIANFTTPFVPFKDVYNTSAEWDSLDPENTIYISLPTTVTYVTSSVLSSACCRMFTAASTRLLVQQRSPDGTWPYKGMINALRSVQGQFWAGFVPQTLALIGTDFVQEFLDCRRNVVMNWIKRRGIKNRHVLQLCHSLCFGLSSCSIYISGLVVRPFWVVTRIMDLQGSGLEASLGIKQYSSWIHCFRDIWATQGIGGFYKGVVPEIVSLVPFVLSSILLDWLTIHYGLTDFNTTWAY